MNIYRVLLNGANFLMSFGEKTQKVGFYTTRFVRAASTTEAENIAVSMLRQDEVLRGNVLNEADDPPVVFADEIEQVTELETASGFSFYNDET